MSGHQPPKARDNVIPCQIFEREDFDIKDAGLAGQGRETALIIVVFFVKVGCAKQGHAIIGAAKVIDDVVGLFAKFTGQVRAVRRLGSAALDLCYVAAGRLDGFWEQRLQAWDIAAGALLVEEAGGRISGLSGGKFNVHAGEVLASNGVIHDAMVAVIKDHAKALD